MFTFLEWIYTPIHTHEHECTVTLVCKCGYNTCLHLNFHRRLDAIKKCVQESDGDKTLGRGL